MWLTTDVLRTENVADWDRQSLLSTTTAQVRPAADTGVSLISWIYVEEKISSHDTIADPVNQWHLELLDDLRAWQCVCLSLTYWNETTHLMTFINIFCHCSRLIEYIASQCPNVPVWFRRCIGLQDPYCGWDSKSQTCIAIGHPDLQRCSQRDKSKQFIGMSAKQIYALFWYVRVYSMHYHAMSEFTLCTVMVCQRLLLYKFSADFFTYVVLSDTPALEMRVVALVL